MFDEFEDEQYVDNQQDDETDLIDSEEPEEEEPEQPRKGNLAAALREEREKRKQYEQRLAEVQESQKRTEALYSQLSQRNHPQPDREAQLEELRNRMFDRPDEVLQQRDAHLISEMRKQMAPMAINSAQSFLSNHPEYREVYSIPEIKQAVDQHIQQAAYRDGTVDTNDLVSTLAGLTMLASKLAGGRPQASKNNGKDRLSSTIGKSSSNGKAGRTDEDIVQDALKNMSPKDYAKFEKDPKNREMINRVLFPKKQE